MTDTAASRQRANDLNALDHFPTCPHCGNLCGRLATKCADCGCALYPPHVTLQLATGVGSGAMRRRRLAAQVREDQEAAREREA